jgi:hypothetical protein
LFPLTQDLLFGQQQHIDIYCCFENCREKAKQKLSFKFLFYLRPFDRKEPWKKAGTRRRRWSGRRRSTGAGPPRHQARTALARDLTRVRIDNLISEKKTFSTSFNFYQFVAHLCNFKLTLSFFFSKLTALTTRFPFTALYSLHFINLKNDFTYFLNLV